MTVFFIELPEIRFTIVTHLTKKACKDATWFFVIMVSYYFLESKVMVTINDKLEIKRKKYEDDIDHAIAIITILRKRLGTKTEYDKKRHRYFDSSVNELRKLQYLIGKIIALDVKSINITTSFN